MELDIAMEARPVSPPIHIYDVRNGQENHMSLQQWLHDFVHPSETTEPFEAVLHHADGSTRHRHLPFYLRKLPTEILYDANGLELFDKITQLEEYYLTRCEREILREKAATIAGHVPDGASVIELGCGSMTKTALLLNQIRAAGKRGVTFYALDIEESYLKTSLEALMQDQREKQNAFEHDVHYAGILGSYEQALSTILKEIKPPRVLLWLGSSIGNWTRSDAEHLVRQFVDVMDAGDGFLIGIDKRNDPTVIAKAYNDKEGVTALFALNGLHHLNYLLKENVFPSHQFDYFAGYNAIDGRHEAYFRSLVEQTISIPSPKGEVNVLLQKDELIRYEFSYKYSLEEVHHLGAASGLHLTTFWEDSNHMYRLCFFQKPRTNPLGHSPMPTLHDWEDVWQRWDQITHPSVISDIYEQPIELRHPIVFYIGHIPTFCDIMLSKGLDEALTEPAYYSTIFERGIDPDVEDPTKCHPHSYVPATWPAKEDIMNYQKRVRERVRCVCQAIAENRIPPALLRRVGRAMHLALEHEVMHRETLIYMLVQSERIRPPVAMSLFESPVPIGKAQWCTIQGGDVSFGIDDGEERDEMEASLPKAFGWDNETPRQTVSVESFQIQHRPVTNSEYLCFMKSLDSVSEDLIPSYFSKCKESDAFGVKTAFGVLPNEICMNWPVALSYHQATAYLKYLQDTTHDASLRIPTEAEYEQFYRQFRNDDASQYNVGFRHWCPTPLSDAKVHVMGSLWEWTSTVLEAHSGFVPSKVYPGYSSDFFDTKHNVVKGGSWATHTRLVGRLRNFYQRSYGFAFIGVRFARALVEI